MHKNPVWGLARRPLCMFMYNGLGRWPRLYRGFFGNSAEFRLNA